MFTNPFRRGRGVARWPKLPLVIDKGGGQDGAHALGVGAPGQVDAKGEDNGVLAFACHGHSCSMSRDPVLVEARDLAGIVGQAAALVFGGLMSSPPGTAGQVVSDVAVVRVRPATLSAVQQRCSQRLGPWLDSANTPIGYPMVNVATLRAGRCRGRWSYSGHHLGCWRVFDHDVQEQQSHAPIRLSTYGHGQGEF